MGYGGAYISSRNLIRKRIPLRFDIARGIHTYGEKNLYPQEVEELMKTSGVTESCVITLGKFTGGMGFKDPNVGNHIVNEDGDTYNDILRDVVQDFALYNGWSLHNQFNLLGQITDLFSVEFKQFRYGLPDEIGRHFDVKWSNNWEMDQYKEIDSDQEVIEFPLYDGDVSNTLKRMTFVGVNHYPGEVLYWTPRADNYPRATFDAVIDSVQTSAEIPLYELSNIQNSFMANGLMRYPGKFANKKEERDFYQQLNEFQGAVNASKIMVVEDPDGAGAQGLMEPFQTPNNDKMFEFTSKNVRNTITQNYGTPHPLLGIPPDSGMFNQEQFEEAYNIYNVLTFDRRKVLEDKFSTLNARMKSPASGSFQIQIRKFDSDPTTLEDQTTTAQRGAAAGGAQQ